MIGYRKLTLYTSKDISRLDNFFKNNPICSLYRSYKYPTFESKNEECILSETEVHTSGGALKIGNREFSMYPTFDDNVKVYLGKDLVIKMPCGYNGNFVKYRIVKV